MNSLPQLHVFRTNTSPVGVTTFLTGRRSGERFYYTGILYERRAKAQLRTGQPPHTVLPLFERALECFDEAEKIGPAGNDDAILRWNRCVRAANSQLRLGRRGRRVRRRRHATSVEARSRRDVRGGRRKP